MKTIIPSPLMKSVDLTNKHSEFKVLGSTARSQAAIMELPAGESTGDSDNKHANADQWLYVIFGSGQAIVEKKKITLKEGTLLLVEAGETHEIHSDEQKPLRLVTFYAPPEY